MLLLSPAQASRAGPCKARAKEKVTGQGKGPFLSTAVRLAVACSVVWPPDKNATPASSEGTCSRRTLAVARPTSEDDDAAEDCLPEVTILTLRMQARRLTLDSSRCWKRASRIIDVTLLHCSMV